MIKIFKNSLTCCCPPWTWFVDEIQMFGVINPELQDSELFIIISSFPSVDLTSCTGLSPLRLSAVFNCLCVCCPDIFRSVLRGHKPLQEPAHLLRGDRWHVQGQEEARDAPSHLRHHRHGVQKHDAGYVRHLTVTVSSSALTSSRAAVCGFGRCFHLMVTTQQLWLGSALKCNDA